MARVTDPRRRSQRGVRGGRGMRHPLSVTGSVTPLLPGRTPQRSPARLRQRSPARLRQRSPARLRQRSPARLRQRSPARLRHVAPPGAAVPTGAPPARRVSRRRGHASRAASWRASGTTMRGADWRASGTTSREGGSPMSEVTTVSVVTPSGQGGADVVLPGEIFGAKVNIPLMHQVVVAQEAAARQGTHATKTRGEVRGGGKKPYRQKGTGRARQGSIRAPQYAGGGIVHGPVPRSYVQRTPKKMKAAALRGALSDRTSHGRVAVVSAFIEDGEPSTAGALMVLRTAVGEAGARLSRSVLV